jgi:hypothetical protein
MSSIAKAEILKNLVAMHVINYNEYGTGGMARVLTVNNTDADVVCWCESPSRICGYMSLLS